MWAGQKMAPGDSDSVRQVTGAELQRLRPPRDALVWLAPTVLDEVENGSALVQEEFAL